ncbi:ROK family protein [Variovorax sp. ZT4R33]|uniref:ROK family protein n=1 Tax=Variovorax sp. ZT4R33 TaxID=3443743 RepID=UPI003F448B12
MAPKPVPSYLADAHGARELPSVTVDGYSLQLRDKAGFAGDAASQTAFRQLLDQWRRRRRQNGKDDPFGAVPSKNLSKREMDRLLARKRASEGADLLHGVIEEFAEELAHVVRRFLREPSWDKVQRIVIGGGFPESDVGERTILQAAMVLQHMKIKVPIARLSHEVDDGGLIGWVHLVPPEMLAAHDAILAVDIGGTNLRCGIVKTRRKKAEDLSMAKVVKRMKWRHADDKPSRRGLLDRLSQMLQGLIDECAAKEIRLAPFVGIACPGRIRDDGSIARGTQNLPGDWESDTFHLPSELSKKLPTIGGAPTTVRLHNDAVVQGLSELPFMRDVNHWAVLTIGTGLGNASYTSKPVSSAKPAKPAKRKRG